MREKEKIIIERFPNERTAKIADDLGLNYGQVCRIAYKYGLKKSDEFIKGPESGRYPPGWKGGLNTQFKKGQRPHNKGKKMPDHVYEKAKNTMFKKGHKPHNTQPDNHISWRPDKTGKEYAYIKISDNVWELYHRFIWKNHHGEIPENHLVYFKDGDSKNINIDNLGIRSLSENMLNNTYVYYPTELKEVIRLKNKLKNKIYGKK